MKISRLTATTISLISSISLSHIAFAQDTQFAGVEFPHGQKSFADAVVSYNNLGQPDPDWSKPDQALGTPCSSTNFTGIDERKGCGAVSLGSGGTITLQFKDNYLTGSGDNKDDLWIFEVGRSLEDTFVEISKDGQTWFSVGKVTGSTQGIDIDASGFGKADKFSFVRLTDDPNEGEIDMKDVGADIDAVGAISSIDQAIRGRY